MKINKKGFAISGILYPLLILTIFLVVQVLFMMQTRKNILDKSKTELADSINSSNKVYTNEELSTLFEQYKSDTDKKITDLKADYEAKIAALNKNNHVNTEKPIFLSKNIKSSNYNPTKIVIKNFDGPIYLEMKIYGQYSYVNYGGYIDYKLGAFTTNDTLYGLGTSIDKQGNLASAITSITPSVSGRDLTLNIVFAPSWVLAGGSDAYFNLKLYRGYGINDDLSATIQ